MNKLAAITVLLLGVSPAHAANARAMKTLRHFYAVAYRQYWTPGYRGTPVLPGANRLRAFGEGPLVIHETTRRERKAFQAAVRALTN